MTLHRFTRLALLMHLPLSAFAAERVDFEKAIKPLLEKACVECHGAEKRKGGLRLDTKEHWLSGGDSGAAMVPGKPEESQVVERISLESDADDLMPPPGRGEHLTPAQIDLIKRWIAQGAAWPAGLVIPSGKVEGPAERAARIGPLPSPIELVAVESLAKRGIKVQPLASGINWRRADLRSLGSQLTRRDLAELSLVGNLRELNLGGLPIVDDDLAGLAASKHLAVLHLENTKITDAALTRLTGLSELRYLNLFGTGVTDAGLETLAALKGLESLFLAGTKASPAGVAALRRKLPDAEIDYGSEFAEAAKPDPVKAADPAKAAPPAKATAPKP